MAFNPYLGWSSDELRAELKKAQKQRHSLAASVTSGDVSVSQQQVKSADGIIEDLYAALHALGEPGFEPADAVRITQTRVSCWNSCGY